MPEVMNEEALRGRDRTQRSVHGSHLMAECRGITNASSQHAYSAGRDDELNALEVVSMEHRLTRANSTTTMLAYTSVIPTTLPRFGTSCGVMTPESREGQRRQRRVGGRDPTVVCVCTARRTTPADTFFSDLMAPTGPNRALLLQTASSDS